RVSAKMKRREFITLLGGAAAAWPLAAGAQQPQRTRRIGVLTPANENDPVAKTYISAFTQALADLWLGRWPQPADCTSVGADINRIRAFAQELVGLQPDVIVTNATPATVAVQRETRTIPIVFANVGDPVASNIVGGFNRPGGNVTGFASFETSMGGKWLE